MTFDDVNKAIETSRAEDLRESLNAEFPNLKCEVKWIPFQSLQANDMFVGKVRVVVTGHGRTRVFAQVSAKSQEELDWLNTVLTSVWLDNIINADSIRQSIRDEFQTQGVAV